MFFSMKYKTTHTSWQRSWNLGLRAWSRNKTAVITAWMFWLWWVFTAYSSSQTEVSLSSITQVCHGVHGWSTATTTHMLICSYNLMCPAVHGKKNKTLPLPHLRSCLHLDSCDLWLFPKMKLKYRDIIQKYLQVVLNGIIKGKIHTWSLTMAESSNLVYETPEVSTQKVIWCAVQSL